MSWYNPVDWIRSAVVGVVEKHVDKFVTVANIKEVATSGVNRLVSLGDERISDERLGKVAQGLVALGSALEDVGRGIDPKGPDGRRFTVDELVAVSNDIESAVGDILTNENVTALRDRIKRLVREKLAP